MANPDYYQILGVEKSASPEEIKRAFRRLAHEHHPDKKGGNEEKFKEINAAYQVLSDPDKRRQYDQFGEAAFASGGGPGFGGFDFSGFSGGAGPGFAGQVNMDDLGDIFGDLFGFGGRRSSARRGQDIQVDVDLTFKEAVFGKELSLPLTKPTACERCGGVGAEPGSKMKTCADCQGAGVRVTTHRTVLGVMQQKTACPTCQGAGETPETSCSTCRGSGLQNRPTTLSVNIPAGVENGLTLRVREQGEAIKGGANGYLLLRLHVRPDLVFSREGDTLLSTVDIGFSQAALGTKITVQTIDGAGELKIPAGTQSGAQFRLKGKGVPGRYGRGDHLITARVVTPKKVSREQKRLLEELDLRISE